jgi:hypothetical protein
MLIVLAVQAVPVAQGVRRTDIARVDEFIDAPRALFGRTRADVERRLGAPLDARPRGAGARLSYPGLEITVSASSRVAAVVLKAPRHALPHGVDVGAPRARVETVLGEAVEMSDERSVYTDADGFPNSVEFYFRDDRISRIEWRFWAD